MAERRGKPGKRSDRTSGAARRPRAAVVPADGAGGARHKLPFLVVGIGASAGGLEAFEKFFTRTPVDSGLAFVLVPHLDATHKSSMVELVQRFTAMKVAEIVDDTRPAPNRVHVIPPNATLTMRRGRLRLTTPRDEPGTVDPFFRSLAEDQGDNAIAVVLSGSGSDGAIGIRAIKEHGGLAVAQAAETSRFGSMPHSAVATGLVDLVLPVEEMPQRLIEYARHLDGHRQKPEEGFGGDHRRSHLARIYTLLRHRTGHDFSRYKDSTFIRRVQRRMQVVRLASPGAYIELLRNEPREVDLLFRDLLIGVTQFFRDPQAFKALVSEVIPKLVEGKSADDQIRVWVPGCSTGEEAYSLAIVIREALAKREVVPKVSIFATDIDGEALDVARAARYPAAIAADLTPERLERFFLREGDHYRVVKDIREMCLFSQHNIISDAPFSRLDLISCRNLLIYLDASLQNRIIPLFHFALRNGGYLFLGPSENVTQHAKLFTRLDGRHRLFKANPVQAQVSELPLGAGSPRGYGPLHKSVPNVSGEETVSRRAARLMESYAPAYVVLDEQYDIVHFAGRTGRYLQPSPGAASLHLFNILDAELRPEVRALLHRATTTAQKAVRENAVLSIDGGRQSVNLIAEPLPAAGGAGRHVVLAFQEAGPVVPPRPLGGDTGDGAKKDETISLLEGELGHARERLQATIEELEASNEEMKSSNEEFQSVNEELQASNEELETSKEELQSVNEELETVNAELNSKVESLERATDDRKNLLESTQIATIFLDRELCVKSFTPAVADIFHLIDSDYGRPITDITLKLVYDHLERDIRKVLRTLERVEEEVATAGGSTTYLMRILPYRATGNVIGGVVITFIDITERKRSEVALARLASIVESSVDAIIAMSPDGLITTWNEGAARMYGYTQEEAIGGPLSFVMPADKRDKLQAVLDRGRRLRIATPIELERVTKDGRKLIVASTVSPIRDRGGKLIAVSAIERDVTPQKQAEERQRMLLAELNHRVKNTLATVLSLLRQSLRHAVSIKEFSQAFDGRIRALAKSHDLLAASSWAGADLEVLVVTALAPYRERGDRVIVSGDAVTLNAPAALLLGMILHELATNAAKYGALSNERGQIEVSWTKSARTKRLVLTWAERNGPRPAEPGKDKGFGLTLIERGLAHELKGEASFEFREGGIRCSLDMPLAEIEAAGNTIVRRRRP